LISGQAIAAGGQQTIVTFGDSTTAPRGPLKVYSALLEQSLDSNAFRVINAGAGGNTTELARKRFEADVLKQSPAIVVIQLGINDSMVDVKQGRDKPRVSLDRYVENLTYFVTELRKINARVILMTPNSLRWTPQLKDIYGKPPYKVDDPDGLNVTIRDYADAVRKLAAKEKLELVDVFAEYETYAKAAGKSEDDLLQDGMHPNDKGQKIVADKLIALINRKPASTKK
jgi:lysophospholipase L1-like esterase